MKLALKTALWWTSVLKTNLACCFIALGAPPCANNHAPTKAYLSDIHITHTQGNTSNQHSLSTARHLPHESSANMKSPYQYLSLLDMVHKHYAHCRHLRCHHGPKQVLHHRSLRVFSRTSDLLPSVAAIDP